MRVATLRLPPMSYFSDATAQMLGSGLMFSCFQSKVSRLLSLWPCWLPLHAMRVVPLSALVSEMMYCVAALLRFAKGL